MCSQPFSGSLSRDCLAFTHLKVEVNRNFSESSCCALSSLPSHFHEVLQISAAHGGTHCKTPTRRHPHPEMKVHALRGETPCVFRNKNLDDFWQEVYQDTKKSATQTLRRKHALKFCLRDSTLRLVQLGYPRRQSGDFSRGGQLFSPKSKHRAISERPFQISDCHRIHHVENPSGKSARILSLFVCGNACGERRHRPACDEMEKSSTTGRDDYFERNQFGCRSWFHVNPLATSIQLLESMKRHVSWTNDSIGKERTSETYFHCIIFTGMMNELAIEDNSHRSDEPNLRTRESSEIPHSSVQVQTPLRDTTHSRRKTRKETGTAEHCRSVKFTYSGSGYPVILAATFCSRARSNKRRKGQHPFKDGLPDETLDIARETQLSEGWKLY